MRCFLELIRCKNYCWHGVDGSRDVSFEDIQSTEQLSSSFERPQATSLLSAKSPYVIGNTNNWHESSFIKQSYTWSRLNISEEHLRRLFTRLKIHPYFLDVVYLFSEKIGPVEEGFSSLFVEISSPTGQSIGSMACEECNYRTVIVQVSLVELTVDCRHRLQHQVRRKTREDPS